MEGLVKAAFPQHQWDHDKFVQPRRAIFTPQTFLQRILRSLFGDDLLIRSNVRDQFGGGPRKGPSLEIDIFLPTLRLGFEYQVAVREEGRGATTEAKREVTVRRSTYERTRQ